MYVAAIVFSSDIPPGKLVEKCACALAVEAAKRATDEKCKRCRYLECSTHAWRKLQERQLLGNVTRVKYFECSAHASWKLQERQLLGNVTDDGVDAETSLAAIKVSSSPSSLH